MIWSVAAAATGLSTGMWTLLLARIVVGVGEASFATLAPTITLALHSATTDIEPAWDRLPLADLPPR